MARTDLLGVAPFDPAQYLSGEEEIAEFLNASIEMNDPEVLLNALSTVARARGMTQLAASAGLGRESLYKALAPGAHPRYDTVMRLIHALGIEFSFRVAPGHSGAAISKRSAASVRSGATRGISALSAPSPSRPVKIKPPAARAARGKSALQRPLAGGEPRKR